MHKKIKSTLSLLLAILMIVTSIPFAFAADGDCEHSDENSTYKNICAECGEYIGNYDLKVGENSGFEIVHPHMTQYLYRFIPEKNASYIFTSNKSDTNSDPYVFLYDESKQELSRDDDSAGNRNFKLTYTFEAGKTYYFSFSDYQYYNGASAYTVTVEVGCEHTGTEQTCKGYKCTNCGEYFGAKGDHKGTEQDCRGYKCDTCETYFGEKDLTKHQWNESGSGKCNLCGASCTHSFVDDGENCSICNALRYAFSVTSGSTTKKYSNLEEALENVKDGDTLKLLKDITFEGYCTYSIKNSIIFDFNGHEIGKSDLTYIIASKDTSVTFTDSVSNSIDCGCSLQIFSKCTLGAGYYRDITLSNEAIENGVKLSDLLPECAGYYDPLDIIDTENKISLTYVTIKQHTPKTGCEGLCAVCGKFYGTELKLGDNELSKDYARKWNEDKYLLKFVPEKTGAYLVKGSKTGKYYSLNSYDADLNGFNGDYSEAYDPTDKSNYDYYQYFNLDAGKTYYFSIETSYSEKVDSTLTISLACEHSSTTQTCKGYICDKCSRYYGEKGDHRLKEEQTCLGYQCKDCSNHYGEKGEHDLSTEQTCKGYKCEYCGYYYGEKDETKHVWSKSGYCALCYTYHDHTGHITDGVCSVCKYQMSVSVTTDGTTEYYKSITDALAAAKDGSMVKLLDDKLEWGELDIDKSITFDLNGHNLDQPSSYSLYVQANVTFIDSVGTGDMEFRVYICAPCTFKSGSYNSIQIADTTQDRFYCGYDMSTYTLGDFLAPCAKYYDNESGKELDSTETYLGASYTNNYSGVNVKATHTLVDDAAVAPSCTQTGKTAGKHCTKCDYKEGCTTVSATGHTFTSVVEAKAPTCKDSGNDAYKQCSVCKKYFSGDATVSSTDGKADNSSFIKTKLSHDFSGDVKNDGDTHSYKCKNGCGTYGNATAHTWDDGTVTTPATHLAQGVKTYKCTCGAAKTEPIAKTTKHTYTEKVTAPTCTEKGYTTYTCACGDSYKDNYVDAKGHEFKDGKCDCGADDPNYQGGTQGGTPGDNTTNCDCICHSSSSFVQFIFKIVNFFWKLFGWHKSCDCGKIHY